MQDNGVVRPWPSVPTDHKQLDRKEIQLAPRNKGTEKTRFTFWLPEDTHAELTELQRATGKESVAEVIREAIRVYQDLLKATADGVDLYFEDSKTGKKGQIWLLPGRFPSRRKRK